MLSGFELYPRWVPLNPLYIRMWSVIVVAITTVTAQGLQILLLSGVTVTSASQISESFWNIWSQVSQWKTQFSDFPARGPGMHTLSWGIHEVAVAVRGPGKLKSMMAFDRNLPSSRFVVQYKSLILMI